MKFAIVPDPHFEHAEKAEFDTFLDQLIDIQPEMILCPGDIADSWNCSKNLIDGVNKLIDVAPTAFILGNHDYYYDYRYLVRDRITQRFANSKKAFYLTSRRPIIFTLEDKIIYVVGVDGSASGKNAELTGSLMPIADFNYISEMVHGNDYSNYYKMRKWALDDITALAKKLLSIDREHLQHKDKECIVVILHHAPVITPICRQNGVGMVESERCVFLSEIAEQFFTALMRNDTSTKHIVICGHTHETARFVSGNFDFRVYGAEYGHPSAIELEL